MDQEQAFWDEIADHPNDDGPLLVYADWLDEGGHSALAESIRIGIQADDTYAGRRRQAGPLPGETAEEMLRREAGIRSRSYELIEELKPYWKKRYKGTSPHVDYYNGLPHTMAIAAKKFLEVADDILDRGPIRSFRITMMPDYAEEVLACPTLDRVRSLDFSRSKMSSNVSLALTCKHTASLRSLHLGGNNSLRQNDLRERLAEAHLPDRKSVV